MTFLFPVLAGHFSFALYVLITLARSASSQTYTLDSAFHLAYSQPQCVALVAMKNVIVELRLLQSFGRPCLY